MTVTGSSRSLLTRFEVGQGSEGLYAGLEVGQDSAGLLGKGDVQQSGSAELLGNAEVTHSVDLLSKGDIRQLGSAELLGNAEVKNIGFAELLGEASITHSTELLCNAIIENISSAALYARAEVGQDSGDLFAKFEAQDTQALYAKGEIRQSDLGELYARAEVGQGSSELFAKAEVGQGSVELFGRGIVRNVASSDLKGIVDVTHSIDLLGGAVIGHIALPVWLKGIFSIGLTNAYRDLGSISELRHDGTPVELLGKAVVRQSGSAELLGKGIIRQSGSSELLGKTEIRNISSAGLLCGFASQKTSDLKAKLIVGPAKNSDAYFSFHDPYDWINEVVGIGQGFIAIPWVEADTVVKTSGDSSARLTSTSAPDQYKEIRFGWGGMNWGFEAAVFPEVAPTPIDTGGRGPRRGSRAQRDRRREVPQSSHEDLAGRFVTQAINDLKASFFAMVNYTSWTMVWSRNYGAAALLDGIYVDDLGNCYFTDGDNSDAYFRSLLGVESTSSDYDYAIQRRAGLPIAVSQGSIGYVLGENEAVYMQFDVRRYGAIVASFNLSTDNPDLDQWLAYAMSSNGKYIAFVVSGLAEGARYVMLYEGS